MGWTAAELPNPPTSSGGNLAGVSCQSSTSCVAVGSADAPGLEALVESLSGTTWTASVLSPPSGFNYANLNGVTCSASTSCVAVGSYFPSFGGYGDALVETLATGSWSPTTGFADGDFSGLSSIGCITMTSSSCVALGSIFTTSPPGQLAVALSGGSWTQTSVSLPSGSDAAFLTGASCLTSCTGAGSDQQSWSVLPGYQATYPMVATFG
jgi:hypothetical protein